MDYDDKYVFDDLGYNLLPSEISAAFAEVQLNHLEQNIENRIANFNYMAAGLANSQSLSCLMNILVFALVGWPS